MDYRTKIYSAYRSGFKGAAMPADLEFNAAKLRPLVEPWMQPIDRGAQIVDLGCGAGELLMAFRALGFTHLSGCDVSAEQVLVARANFPEVREANLFDYLRERPDESLDVVTAFDVLEHLGPQTTFDLMELLRRKLRKGGLIIAHLPNGFSPFHGEVLWSDMTHAWCLTPVSAESLCRLHGFASFEAVEHLGASTNLLGIARKLAWRLTKIALRCINLIETGHPGGHVWTRNFAFKAVKQ